MEPIKPNPRQNPDRYRSKRPDRPVLRTQRPPTRSVRPTGQARQPKDEWGEFYAEQAHINSDVLWVERPKEKTPFKDRLIKFSRSVVELHDKTDYKKFFSSAVSRVKWVLNQPIIRRTGISLGILSLLLVISSIFINLAPSTGSLEVEDVLGSQNNEITFDPIVPAEADSELTIDNIVGSAIIKDDIDGAPIVISQQTLPAEAAENSDFVEGVAQSVPNTLRIESFTTEFGRTHLATAYNGKQVLIFATNDSLITISSNLPIYATDWSDYVNSLATQTDN